MLEFFIPSAIIAILVLLNGLFVSAEFAIVAVPRTRIAQLAKQGSKKAKSVLAVLESPNLQNRFITTAQVGITIVSLGLGMYGEHVLAEWIIFAFEYIGGIGKVAAHTLASVLSIGILTYFHVVIGEMIPKSLALHSAEQTIMFLAMPMRFLERIFFPLVWLLNLISTAIIRIIGLPPMDRTSRLFTSDELEYIVEESSVGGLIDPEEKLYIENILDLQERTIEQVMTPRNRIVGLPIDSEDELIYKTICQTTKSRYPIYEDDLDQIIGFLHIKDLARFCTKNPAKKIDLKAITHPSVFIPESLSLHKTLILFQRQNLQIAVVLDEFGGTAGIITLEDLVEEVVGEIQDEFDIESHPMVMLGNGIVRVRGDLIIDEINQHHNLDIHHPEAITIGGLAMAILGRIPRATDKFNYQGLVIEIEAVERRAVKYAIVHLPATD